MLSKHKSAWWISTEIEFKRIISTFNDQRCSYLLIHSFFIIFYSRSDFLFVCIYSNTGDALVVSRGILKIIRSVWPRCTLRVANFSSSFQLFVVVFVGRKSHFLLWCFTFVSNVPHSFLLLYICTIKFAF